jgi:aminoglycoside/choline kinase family phosphotransferase
VIAEVEKKIIQLYARWAGQEPERMHAIAASGSPRKYFRLGNERQSVIGAYNPDLSENDAFIYLTKHFTQKGLPVPEMLAEDRKSGTYLISDLGNNILFELLSVRPSHEEVSDELYDHLASSVRMLPHFQLKGSQGLDWSICYPRDRFDIQSMMWDLNYFKYYILKTSGITFNEQLLENDFKHFAEFLMQADQDYFMYRDFQSRNILLHNNQPFFIDYQGGRKGPLQYDLASFLYQVKARLPNTVREKLIEEYLEELNTLGDVEHDLFMKYFYPFVYLRMMQVMGAYGFRGLFEKRPHFADSLEPAIAALARLINVQPLEPELTELKSALRKLTQNSKYMHLHHKQSELLVNINSFSYKNGLPEDNTGHGGGFIFDCRSLPNPGRLEEYKALNGRDKEVIHYLKKHREVDKFLYNIFEVIDSAVENYIEREFSNLDISFGCTGGQHRSVYCADRLFEHLSKKYVIKVRLNHREQKITETKMPKDV